MLLLGIDPGTSSIKVSVVDADTQKCIAAAQYPETEVDIISTQPVWAQQSPDLWWEHVKQAILKCKCKQAKHNRNTFSHKRFKMFKVRSIKCRRSDQPIHSFMKKVLCIGTFLYITF
jgi:FGGY family of carbohydrate kinases, N-terminal domain